MGAPIGSESYVRSVIEKRLREVKELTDKLESLKDTQIEYVLLCLCLQLPKIIYILHIVDPTPFKAQWHWFDHVTQEALTTILGSAIINETWKEVKLPTTMGGLRLPAIEDHAPAAYISSLLSTHELVKSIVGNLFLSEPTVPDELLQVLIMAISDESMRTQEDISRMNQRALSVRIDL